MNDWGKIEIDGIAGIEKCVGEYRITELYKSPYAYFKIKIYEQKDSKFLGVSNILIKDNAGDYICAIGHGNTESEALHNTIQDFKIRTEYKQDFYEDDFQWSDPTEF